MMMMSRVAEILGGRWTGRSLLDRVLPLKPTVGVSFQDGRKFEASRWVEWMRRPMVI